MGTKHIAKKAKPVRPRTEAELDELNRFVNEEARAKYEVEVRERKLHQEKGFVMTNAEGYGVPADIAETIDDHNWQSFAAHPRNPVVPLVREFYSNILTPNQTFSMVRGIKVSFSASSILMHFGLENIEDDYEKMVENISESELNFALKALTVEGTSWLPEKGERTFKCARPALKPLVKVWYQFIRTRLLPTTHIETVNRERLVLLHCILEGKGINVGNLLQKEISACAFKPKGCLFFPSLITDLCLRSGLEVSQNDEVVPNSGAINTAAIKRFVVQSAKTSAKQPSSQPASTACPNDNLANQLQKLQEMLQHQIMQQQKFWEFAKAAHIWQRRVFELNFKNKVLNPPRFPESILQPFAPANTESTPSPASQEEPVDSDSTPSPPQAATSQPASKSRKGKEKMPQYEEETIPEHPRSSPRKRKQRTPATRTQPIRKTLQEVLAEITEEDAHIILNVANAPKPTPQKRSGLRSGKP